MVHRAISRWLPYVRFASSGFLPDGLRRLRFFLLGLSVEGSFELLELFMLRRRSNSDIRASDFWQVFILDCKQMPAPQGAS